MASNDFAAKSTDTVQGFTKEGLAEYNAKFHKFVDEGKLANVVSLIARHGEIVNCDAYGVADISASPPEPVKTDSIFRIASMTKPITSAAILMLCKNCERCTSRWGLVAMPALRNVGR